MPLESSCVIAALIENYSNSKPLKVSPEKSQILNCGTVVANERYALQVGIYKILCKDSMYFGWEEHCSVLYNVFEGVHLICIAFVQNDFVRYRAFLK